MISNLGRQKINVHFLEKCDIEKVKCVDCEKYITTKLIYVIKKWKNQRNEGGPETHDDFLKQIEIANNNNRRLSVFPCLSGKTYLMMNNFLLSGLNAQTEK